MALGDRAGEDAEEVEEPEEPEVPEVPEEAPAAEDTSRETWIADDFSKFASEECQQNRIMSW